MNDFGTPEERKNQVIEFRNKLNDISPSMCFAKWQQVTMHLGTGHTHSCHHPSAHKIPIEEVKQNYTALHNTNYKKEQRKLMLEGKRPKECDYCWKVEDSDSAGTVFSDRIMKSLTPWAKTYADRIANSSYNNDVNPSYLEVSFSNTCNFKCSYCSPEVSSKWMEEINQHGSYPTSTSFNNIEWLKQSNKMPILEREVNPYIDAFWQWWPELYPTLEVLRITGGEPLLTKNTFKVLDYVLSNPNTKLELNVNSNLCVPDELLNKFIDSVKRIQDAGAVGSFKMYTSCEATGAKAEYIRYGLDYNKWLDNCNRIMSEIPNTKLTVTSTYNALSVTSFETFLSDMLKLKIQYSTETERNAVGLDIPYLRWPHHQAINILTPDYLTQVENQVTFMYKNMQQTHWPPLCGKGYYDYDINRMERVYRVFENHLRQGYTMETERKDFAIFIDEHDKRRGTNFLKTFPEMEEFYKLCKSL
jgi:organic radical activating enzyme